jgi:hypothetical protein
MNNKTVSPEDPLERRLGQLRNMLAQHHERFPQQLAARFPHILERIVSSWNNEDKTRKYFKTLMAPESRFGFPADVYQEIFLLSKFFDKAHPPLEAKRADIWVGFTV